MTNPNQDGEAFNAVIPAGEADSENDTTVRIPESTETAEDNDDKLSRRQRAALEAKAKEQELEEVKARLAKIEAEKAEFEAKQTALEKFGVTARDLKENQETYDGILKEYVENGMNKAKAIEFAIRDLKNSRRSGSTLPPRGTAKPSKAAQEFISRADLEFHLNQRNPDSRAIVKKVKSGEISVR